MRFLSFTISHYRAIRGPLTIDVDKRGLIPIIGINESGKTTILQAVLAWDNNNDYLNARVHHLDDVSNLYATQPTAPTVSARVEFLADELVQVLKELKRNVEHSRNAKAYLNFATEFPAILEITRDLSTKKYSINHAKFHLPGFNDVFAREIARTTPFILYFDDFRDSVEEVIEITQPGGKKEAGPWLEIVNQLFKRVDSTLSVYQLPDMEVRRRKSVLAKVVRKLNNTLTREWQTFRLEDSDALRISLEYYEEEGEAKNPATGVVETITRPFIKFEVIETDADGDEHFFFIKDRSKGFFWFFNFVMKLEFNPKVMSDDDKNTIYLLDEPGSYLHAAAQRRLCKKLKALSSSNKVLYCTHSHYLLDPEVIPIGSLHVANRDGNGYINLSPFHEFEGSLEDHKIAFQPLMDALQVKPFMLDISQRNVMVVEGATDFYAYDMFRERNDFGVLPARNADAITYVIGLLVAWQVKFVALWDNDPAGRQAYERVAEDFGKSFRDRHLRLLPARAGSSKRILQDLFEGKDIAMIKTRLGMPKDSNLKKVLLTLYYSPERDAIVRDVGAKTRANFAEVYRTLFDKA